MIFDAIDSIHVATAALDACRGYERLGLRLSPARGGRRTLHVGGPSQLFAVHFLADEGADSPLAQPLRRALAAGRSLFAVGLCVADLDAAVGSLGERGLAATRFREGSDECAWLSLQDQAGADLLLVQHALPDARRHAEAVRAGLLDHAFPLRRLDHLAIVTHDLGPVGRFWSEMLVVPAAGEVSTPTMVIRQLRLGDAVLELLGPASADSPLLRRPPGPAGMASWEVAELDGAVRLARAAGFSVPDPGAGPLPGTRIATVPGDQLAGLNLQLLQYV